MEHITRTLWFSDLQSCMVRGAPYSIKSNTTLNQKFSIQPNETPGGGVYPILSYMCIGRGALKMEIGGDGKHYPVIQQHASTDAALFEHMPFVLRQLNDDLPPAKRNDYALRKQVTINSVTYWAYYAKRVDFTTAVTKLYLKQVVGGNATINDYIPDASNLNPVHQDLSNPGTNLLAGQSVMASTIIGLHLDSFDIAEIRNASIIETGETDRALISEVALCTGSSKVIQAPTQGGSFSFNEAIAMQVATFIQALYPLDFINNDIVNQLELGISEPLFKFEGINP